MKISKFTDLDAWREAHKSVGKIYKITQDFSTSETYGFTSQLLRAAVSITANIAEGFSRFYYKERVKFYFDARGSLSEIQSEPLDAKTINLLTDSRKFDIIWVQTEKVHLILNGLIRKTGKLSENS